VPHSSPRSSPIDPTEDEESIVNMMANLTLPSADDESIIKEVDKQQQQPMLNLNESTRIETASLNIESIPSEKKNNLQS